MRVRVGVTPLYTVSSRISRILVLFIEGKKKKIEKDVKNYKNEKDVKY